MNIYRHGDVDIIQIDSLPEGLKTLDHLTVAEGEATGHHHVLVAERKDIIKLMEDSEGRKYIQILDEGASIVHEEHKQIQLKPGMYIVKIEQEFDPFKEAISAVRD